jgi:ubiquinone/menaquinone biosynthesis C-methylase UbiE
VDRRRAGDRLQLLKEQRVSVSVLQRRRLEAAEVERLDPYVFMAVIGKRIIHPGGRAATEQLLKRAAITGESRVLDVGCGVGTTAIGIAERFGAEVTAVDIEPLMLERANEAVRAAHAADRVHIQEGDILALGFPDSSFDVVIAEAVTMFVDRAPAAGELIRVCRPGGRVLATEFMWRRPPSEEAREAFLGQVCPGLRFDTADDWVRIYSEAGLSNVEIDEGPFEMMSPKGFVQDEGVGGSLSVMRRVMTRPAYMKKMAWLMPRMRRAVPYLGYIVVSGEKQPQTTHTDE